MSEKVSNVLALPYDPTIQLYMVLANGGVDQSLRLAHNVPFLVGDIVLYLQVHVLRTLAYCMTYYWAAHLMSSHSQ